MAALSYVDAATARTIHDAEASLWATDLELYGQTCAVLRPTQTRNAVTGYAQTYGQIAAVPCLVLASGLRPQDRRVGEALRAETSVTIFVPDDTDAKENDRIEDGSGVAYEVLGKPTPMQNSPTLKLSVTAIT